MLKSKRVRTANWDSSDKILLRQLIEEKISIIENKNVDTNTSRLKKDAWRTITNSFNSISATMRETSQLQAQWRGTKMKAKADNSAYQRSLKATGGGPPPKSPDHEHIKLMELIPHEFEEDQNVYDCDTVEIGKDFEDIEFLEDESPKKTSPPPPSLSPAKVYDPSPPSPKNKSASLKRKTNCKDDNLLKTELFDSAIENRRTEKKYMQLEHEERMKTILMERNEILTTYEMERRHKEEIHELKMRRLQEEHFSF